MRIQGNEDTLSISSPITRNKVDVHQKGTYLVAKTDRFPALFACGVALDVLPVFLAGSVEGGADFLPPADHDDDLALLDLLEHGDGVGVRQSGHGDPVDGINLISCKRKMIVESSPTERLSTILVIRSLICR